MYIISQVRGNVNPQFEIFFIAYFGLVTLRLYLDLRLPSLFREHEYEQTGCLCLSAVLYTHCPTSGT